MSIRVTSKTIADKFPLADLSALATANPGSGKPWLNGGFLSVGAVSAPAADSAVVHIAGAETITGAKTFSGRVTANAQVATDALLSLVWNTKDNAKTIAQYNQTTGRLGMFLQDTTPMIQLGGTTSAYPAIKRNSTAVNFRLADDSADAPITASNLTLSGNMAVAQGFSLMISSTYGIRIPNDYVEIVSSSAGIFKNRFGHYTWTGNGVETMRLTASGIESPNGALLIGQPTNDGVSLLQVAGSATFRSSIALQNASGVQAMLMQESSNFATLSASATGYALQLKGNGGGVRVGNATGAFELYPESASELSAYTATYGATGVGSLATVRVGGLHLSSQSSGDSINMGSTGGTMRLFANSFGFYGNGGTGNTPVTINGTLTVTPPSGTGLTVNGDAKLAGTYPSYLITPSGWAGSSFYFQAGVDAAAVGTGNYTAFVNVLGKGFSWLQGNPGTTGRYNMVIAAATGNVLFGTATDDGVNTVQVNGKTATGDLTISAINQYPFQMKNSGTTKLFIDYSGLLGSYGGVQVYGGTFTSSVGATITGGGVTGTDGINIGSYGSGYGGIWPSSVTPSSTNYAIAIHANETNINSPSTVSLATGAANRWTVNSSGHFKPAVDNTYDAGGTSNKIRSLYTVSAVLGNTGTVTATQYGQLIGTHVGIRDAWSLSSISGTYPYGLLLGADSHLYWSSTADYYGTRDLGIARNAAGVLEINNGTTIAGGGSYGSLKAGATTLAGNLTFNNGNTVIISLNSTYNTSIRGSFDSIQLLSTSLLIAGPSGTTCGVSITGSLSMSGDFRLSNSVAAPVTSTDTTNVGVVRFDSNYLYVAVGTNSWKRVALSTW